MGHQQSIEIRVAGRLRMIGPDGAEIALRGQRRQALVLLLATAPGLRRSRAFVQDKLWSEKDGQRAAASLRQLLTDLRQALGPHRAALVATDGWVGFDESTVRVRRDPAPEEIEPGGDPPEMAEGLDVEDPEFEDWIRDQRLAFADRLTARSVAPEAATMRPELVLCPAEGGDAQMVAFANMVVAEVGFRVARIGGVDVLEAPEAVVAAHSVNGWMNGARRSIRLGVRVVPAGPLVRLQAWVSDVRSGSVLWSGHRVVDPYGADGGKAAGFGRVVNELTMALYRVIGTPPAGAGPDEQVAVAAYTAIAGSNLRTAQGLREAETQLAAAADLHGSPTLTAWWAMVKGWQVIERVAPVEAGLEEAMDLAGRALEADPLDPTALTVAAELSDIRGGPFNAVELAQLAVDIDPIDAFAAAGLAKALMRHGKAEQGHGVALRAARLANGHRDRPWWKMLCCVTAVHSGRYDEALQYARAAHDLAPNFRPPMRFLLGLQFHAGEEEAVVRTAERLRRLEPDFDAAALKDPDYPLRLQGTPLLAVADSGLF